MKTSGFSSTSKKVILVSLAFLALLLFTGALTTPSSAGFSGGSGSAGTFSSSAAVSTTQTDSGTLTLMGTTAGIGAIGSPTPPRGYFIPSDFGSESTKPTLVAGNTPLPSFSQVISEATSSAGSASPITQDPSGLTTALGVNAFDSGSVNLGLDVEPPDQGLCVGNGYVIDVVNLVLRVYSTKFHPVSPDVSIASLVGFPVAGQFNSTAGGYILSDPRCLYDTGTGHWFLSLLYLGGPGVFSNSGPFPLKDFAYEIVLASKTSSPLNGWNVYSLDVTNNPYHSVKYPLKSKVPVCPCFGDQPLLGADANALIISTNAFPIFTGGFFGAQVYLFNKAAMANGNSFVKMVYFNIGQKVNPPDGSCKASQGLYCFYSVNPATSPTTNSYDTSNGGTAWAMSSLDFTGAGDNRIAVWSFSDTSSLNTAQPKVLLSLRLGQNLEFYYNPGFLVPQKKGPIPLGNVFFSYNPNPPVFGCKYKCPEGGLASNGDGMWDTVVYAQGALWGAINTLVNEAPPSFVPSYHMGVAFWVVNAADKHVSLANQGYVAAENEELLFPSIGVGPWGQGVMAFALTGKDYFPSTAYAYVNRNSGGSGGSTIFVADLGKSPQDGFTEYQFFQTIFYRPRWGDYSWAVWSNGRVYFSTEYIQHPNCGNGAFLSDPTCGGTRDPFANWGTSLNSVGV